MSDKNDEVQCLSDNDDDNDAAKLPQNEDEINNNQKYDPVTKNFEYLEHPADIQLHSWGEDLRLAFQSSALAMFNYMTDVNQIEPDSTREIFITAETHLADEDFDGEKVHQSMVEDGLNENFSNQMKSENFEENPEDNENVADGKSLYQSTIQRLLFTWLDECLYLATCDPFFIAREIEIIEFDEINFHLRAILYGEPFDLYKHQQGTEIKAITYSAMKVIQHEDEEMDDRRRCEIYCIVDI